MAKIQSKTVSVNASSETVFTYLSDMNNLQELMPAEKIQNWESTSETCKFTIKGLAGIGMKQEGSVADSQVNIISHGKNPFDFTLKVDITEQGETCNAQLTFDGNMNFMIQTMASGPLTNLFNMMADNLVAKYNV
jgi:carbon monoxide dehydrogenase subunit G